MEENISYNISTILFKMCWDTCSSNHHYVHNQDVCVQNDTLWFSVLIVHPRPPPTKQCCIHMSLMHSHCTILDKMDFGERGTEELSLPNVPTVLYKIVVLSNKYLSILFWGLFRHISHFCLKCSFPRYTYFPNFWENFAMRNILVLILSGHQGPISQNFKINLKIKNKLPSLFQHWGFMRFW